MIKKLTKHGNSMALVIDRPILEILKISETTPLELSTDGESLHIVPVKDKERVKSFKAALKRANKKYGKTLKRLA